MGRCLISRLPRPSSCLRDGGDDACRHFESTCSSCRAAAVPPRPRSPGAAVHRLRRPLATASWATGTRCCPGSWRAMQLPGDVPEYRSLSATRASGRRPRCAADASAPPAAARGCRRRRPSWYRQLPQYTAGKWNCRDGRGRAHDVHWPPQRLPYAGDDSDAGARSVCAERR